MEAVSSAFSTKEDHDTVVPPSIPPRRTRDYGACAPAARGNRSSRAATGGNAEPPGESARRTRADDFA